jgi:plastocyanin
MRRNSEAGQGVLGYMVKRILTIALAAAALGIAACGGADEPATSTAPAAPASGATTVAIGDNSFTPATTKVAVGETVEFENGGAIPHTVTGEDFDSGSLASGDSFTFTADKAGKVSYVCLFHPGMQGTIEVR